MIRFYLDIETCPSQSPDLRAELLAGVKPPATFKKPESIAEWMKENAEAEAEAALRKTSFDGAYGHVCVVGLAIDDNEPMAIYENDWLGGESRVLATLFKLIDELCKAYPNERALFIGHHVAGFDLRFLFQRAVVLGVMPSHHLPFFGKPWDDRIFDTMLRWAGLKGTVSQDKLARALGLPGKGEIDGSKVWDYVKAGRIDEVAAYCRDDVRQVREIHRRMAFIDEAA